MRLLLAAVILSASSGLAVAEEAGDADRGLSYARDHCSECHAVERGETLSPNELAPTFAEVANTTGMSRLALVSFFQTPHEEMPNFIVPADDVRDLVTYILSLKR
jgi:mono/diheme cytochrome c family protein